jgi:hypothetical protein
LGQHERGPRPILKILHFPQWKVENPYESLKKMCINMDETAIDLLFKLV